MVSGMIITITSLQWKRCWISIKWRKISWYSLILINSSQVLSTSQKKLGEEKDRLLPSHYETNWRRTIFSILLLRRSVLMLLALCTFLTIKFSFKAWASETQETGYSTLLVQVKITDFIVSLSNDVSTISCTIQYPYFKYHSWLHTQIKSQDYTSLNRRGA